MTIALESMAVEMPEVVGHPNRAAFRGVLAVVDRPSQRAPHGSGGRRVVLARRAAEKALPSLLGMALDYAPALDRHDARRKVGVITSAEIAGRDLEVGGYLFAKDFPEIVDEIARAGTKHQMAARRSDSFRERIAAYEVSREKKTVSLRFGEGVHLRAALRDAVGKIFSLKDSIRAHRQCCVKFVDSPIRMEAATSSGAGAGLGMSYEVTGVEVADSHDRVLILTRVVFTGAAILRREKAAYADTWIELC
jgi:hypothetical protein